MKINDNLFTVRRSESGKTLIGFIADCLKVSNKKAKALLDQRCVFVNGKRIWMARHALQAGDKVEVTAGAIADKVRFMPAVDNSTILFQDSDLLIANKPPGILTNGPKSLENALQIFLSKPHPWGESARRGGNKASLTAVHRLDKDTSGCLLFAKHADVKRRLILLFSHRSIRKIYHAIVSGKITETTLTITKPIDGQTASSSLRVLDANRLASHVRIIIETGRTHQIRKHLTHIQHPVMGDKTYASRRQVSSLERVIQRQMLHAYQLSFKHPINNKLIRCIAPLPDDFRQCLKRYRLR